MNINTLLCIVILGCPLISQANVVYPAASLNTNTALYDLPYRYLGEVTVSKTGGIFAGSGYVVLPRAAITAAHVVFDSYSLSWSSSNRFHWRHHSNVLPTHTNGEAVFYQIFSAYASRFSGGQSFGQYTNVDTAALWSTNDLANGGCMRALWSDDAVNPHLTSNRTKTLLGYPAQSPYIPFNRFNLMHATQPGNYIFQASSLRSGATDSGGLPWRLWENLEAPSYAGNSGGPLMVLMDDGLYYPAATLVSGIPEEIMTVRAIDSDIITLVENANLTGGGYSFDFGTAPVISSSPVDITVARDTVVSFSISATGTPTPQYQWQFNGIDVLAGSGDTITFNPVQEIHEGTFRVIVYNHAGNTVSQSFHVTVSDTEAPSILLQPVSLVIDRGTMATFTVTVSGLPTPSIEWRKNGQIMNGANEEVLTFNNAQIEDSGSYQLFATNSEGSAFSNSATLTVEQTLDIWFSENGLSGTTSDFLETYASGKTPTQSASGEPYNVISPTGSNLEMRFPIVRSARDLSYHVKSATAPEGPYSTVYTVQPSDFATTDDVTDFSYLILPSTNAEYFRVEIEQSED